MKIINSTIAVAMLGIMFVLMFFSAWGDSATMDELAHIPAGYSYLAQKDYRLNPEHPPLIKDLAAFPLLYLNLNFPTDVGAWKNDVNGQWDMGRIFLYESGNNADKILRFSRFPIMLLALIFGWLLFRWVRGIYGDEVGLLTLFFYSFSPTFIAHSRYVTTDLAAAFGFFIGIAAFIIESQIDYFGDDRQMRLELYVFRHGNDEAELVVEDHDYNKGEGGAFLVIIDMTPEHILINTKGGKQEVKL